MGSQTPPPLTGQGCAATLRPTRRPGGIAVRPSNLAKGSALGQVDLNFRPSFPVFDASLAIGRRHDKPVREDTVAGTLHAMDLAGVEKALAYHQHAVNYDSDEGNRILLDMIEREPRLVPQFAGNPAADDLDRYSAQVAELGVRSVRMSPILHKYPFRDWVVGEWLEWLSDQRIPLWLDAAQFDPAELHDTLSGHPNVDVVLSEVHYSNTAWVLPLLRSLPNLHIEISRFVISDGIARLLDAVGGERVLFGSRFPGSPIAPQLYNLYRCELDDATLKAICAGNLVRLLGEE